METNPYNFEDDYDRLKRENTEKKKKLEAEQGAKFFTPENGDEIDPVIENQFLKNIEEFEKSFHSAKRVKVYDFIGRPQFKKVSEIPDDEISSMLDNIMQLLLENQIELSTLCEVDDRELYRFITEELFEAETDDMRVEGMMCCYTYEEFHPNHDYDIRRICDDFTYDFIKRQTEFFEHTLTQKARNDKNLNDFINSFSEFELIESEIIGVKINPEDASLLMNISLFATIESSVEKQQYSGQLVFNLIPEYGYWSIDKVDLSGLNNT
jgi:hypothetical protein